MFQRTEWWWYNIFQSGDTRCKVTFLHLCLALYFPSLSFSHPEIHLHPLTLRYINISQNMRMCVVFLPDCPCCEPLTVKGWITTILFFFFTQPVNEYGATYPLNLFFSSLAIFFPLPHFIRGGLYSSFPPFFSATSCVACFSAPLFYISSGDFMCSLIFSQFSLSSSILSVPPMPLLLRAEVWHNFSKSSWPLPPLRARPPPLPFHLSCFSVHHPPSFFFFFCHHMITFCFLQTLFFADDTGKHFACLNYASRLHKNLTEQLIYF